MYLEIVFECFSVSLKNILSDYKTLYKKLFSSIIDSIDCL